MDKQSRRGVHFESEEINQIYDFWRDFLWTKLECRAVFKEEETLSHHHLILAELHRIEIPKNGGNWGYSKRNLNTLDWEAVTISRPNTSGGWIAFLGSVVFPFRQQNDLSDIFSIFDPLFSLSLDLQQKGMERHRRGFSDAEGKQSDRFHLDWRWTKHYQRMQKVFVTTVIGKPKQQRAHSSSLSGEARVMRAFRKCLWKHLDKEFIQVVGRIYYKQTVSLRDLLYFAQHKDALMAVSRPFPNRVSLLPLVPHEAWTTPSTWTKAGFKNYFGVTLSQADIDWLLTKPFGLVDMFRRFKNPHCVGVLQAMEQGSIPTWVQLRILNRHHDKLSHLYRRIRPKPLKSVWQTEFHRIVGDAFQSYLEVDGYQAMLKGGHPFWGELDAFVPWTYQEEDVAQFSDLPTNPLRLVSTSHPWSSRVLQRRLQANLEQALGTEQPKTRRL